MQRQILRSQGKQQRINQTIVDAVRLSLLETEATGTQVLQPLRIGLHLQRHIGISKS